MADPVSAIGIAAAAVEFFSFSAKAISLCKQIHSNASGATQANEDLERSIRKLSDIQKELRITTVGAPHAEIAKAQRECLEIFEKLLKLLDGLKASSQLQKSRFLKNVSATWSAMRSKSKVEKLEAKLRIAERQFMSALTIDTRNAIEEILQQQGKDTDVLEKLREGMQELRPEVKHAREESKVAHAKTHEGLATAERKLEALDVANTTSHLTTHKEIGQLGSNMEQQFENSHVSALHREILGGLEFPEMNARQQDIKPPAEGTFEWVFDGTSPHKVHYDKDRPYPYEHAWRYDNDDVVKEDLALRARLLQWLKSDEPIFWVNGKAGSGKSSLMSFIANDDRSMEALRLWSNDSTVYIIKFFFWKPGSPLQRSIPGLLRSLLYQLLNMDPKKIDDLQANGLLTAHSDWPQAKLLKTLGKVLDMSHETHICFFIDGLDEHDGDYTDLLDLLLQTKSASKIKTCLSSRPEPAFLERLQRFSSISMQDLNRADIETLVRQKLQPYEVHHPLLVHKVTGRAEGIFLWAVLVCGSLVAGHAAHDSTEMLEERLNAIPSGLRELFNHMFSKIDEPHRKSLVLYCYLLKWNSQHLTFPPHVELITASLHAETTSSLEEFLSFCETVEKQIVAQSKGLIEIAKEKPGTSVINAWSLRDQMDHKIPLSSTGWARNQRLLDFANLRIQWVHRTAHDCIFGENNERIAAWLRSIDEDELRRQVVFGCLWLARWSPTTRVIRKDVDSTAETRSVIFGLTKDVATLCSFSEQRNYQALDTMLDLLVSSFDHGSRENCRKLLLDCQVKQYDFTPIEWTPLVQFWHAICSGAVHGYYLSRFDQLENHSFASAICADLIIALGEYDKEWIRGSYAPRLLDVMSRKLALDAQSMRSSGQLTPDRHCEVLGQESSYRRLILTWEGNGGHVDLPIVLGVAEMLHYDYRGEEDEPALQLTRMIDMFNTRIPLIGVLNTGADNSILPPQFLWGIEDYAKNYAAHLGHALPQSIDDVSPALRLMCLRTPGHPKPKVTDERNKHWSPEVVASIEMSSTVKAMLLDQKVKEVDYEKGGAGTCWLGTPADFTKCHEAIVSDIWADAKHELNAWQQLYALACVKTYFRMMWISEREAPSPHSSSGEESENSDVAEID